MRSSTAYVSQATGRRTVLNPRCARLSTNSLVIGGFPQPVSQLVVLSSVLPMLIPGLITAAAAQASCSFIFSGPRGGAAALGAPGAADRRAGGVRQASGCTAERT